MALTPISNSVEFVQDSVPTTAADGDSWLDTSQSPPRLKVFDDAVGGFIEPRSVQNRDEKISNAGKTATSPESLLNNATHFTASAKETNQTTTTFTLASGSGFIVSISANSNGTGVVKSIRADNGPDIINKNGATLIRFENKVETTLEGGTSNADDASVSIDGIFD